MAVGGCGGFYDRGSLAFEKYRVLRGSHFDIGGRNGGDFVLLGFSRAAAYEGLDEVEHY